MLDLQDMFDNSHKHSFFSHTAEARARISEAATKRQSDPTVRAEISARSREALARPEVRAKLIGREVTAETRAKISAATKGISKHNEETRAKISANAKIREANRKANGFKMSDEAKAKISAAGKLKARPVMTPAGVFDNTKEAGLHYGVGAPTISYRIHKYPDQYYYVAKKQQQNG